VDISVTDNGIGMSEESIDKIFEIFQRLHSKDKYGGSGIGLALCRRIVDIHKGKITVKSTEVKGTTFIISLPSAR
jgi:signal transduction histidine kinase